MSSVDGSGSNPEIVKQHGWDKKLLLRQIGMNVVLV